MNTSTWYGMLTLSVALALTGCGGGSSSHHGGNGNTGDNNTPGINGVAAQGAALANGDVTAICAIAPTTEDTTTDTPANDTPEPGAEPPTNKTFSTQTDADGNYSLTLDDATLPCAIKVEKAGTPTFYSYAKAAGTANITPLTDLAVRLAATPASPAAWFDEGAAIPELDMQQAIDELLSTLARKGYGLPDDNNPLTSAFVANGEGWDGLIDVVMATIGNDYNSLAAAVTNGEGFDSLPAAPTTGLEITGSIQFEDELGEVVINITVGTESTSNTYDDNATNVTFINEEDIGLGTGFSITVASSPEGQHCSIEGTHSGTVTLAHKDSGFISDDTVITCAEAAQSNPAADPSATALGSNFGITAKIAGKERTIANIFQAKMENGQVTLQATAASGENWLIDVPAVTGTHHCNASGVDGDRTFYSYSSDMAGGVTVPNPLGGTITIPETWVAGIADNCTMNLEIQGNNVVIGTFSGTATSTNGGTKDAVTNGGFRAQIQNF